MKQMKIFLSLWIIVVVILRFQSLLIASPLEENNKDIQEFSLKQVQDYAVKHSTETRNAQLDVATAKKKIWETTAIGLPQIDASVSYQNNMKIPTTLIPAQFLDPDAEEGSFVGVKFGTQHNATLNVTVNQLVFNGSYIVGLQASRIYLRLSQDQLVKSEIEVKENVTRTYYLILLAENNKKILETTLENLKKIHFDNVELHKAGFIEDTDVHQIQLSVTDMENAVKSIDRQIKITYRLLKFQMGLDLNQKIKLSQSLGEILEQINEKELMKASFVLADHIDYKAMSTQEKSLKLLLKNEKASYLPTVSAYLSYSQMAMRDSFNLFSKDKWFPAMIFGVNVNIPIFSSGMRGAKVAQAKMDLRKTVNLKKKVEDGLQLEILQAKSEFADALEKKQNTKANVQLAKKIYDKTVVKYRSGTVSSLELTQIHNQYLTSESNHTAAMVEMLNAKIRLEKALSRL